MNQPKDGATSTNNKASEKTTVEEGGGSSFWQLPSWMEEFMDEQRIERLAQCRALEQTYRDCLDNKNNNNRRLEDFPMGIRMVRYFDWRNLDQPQQQQDGVEGGIRIRPCVREEHAVWACRSVALQCGNRLAALKSCFDEAGPDVVLRQSTQTAYQSSTANAAELQGIPCQTFQQKVGECVSKGTEALAARKKRRQEQR